MAATSCRRFAASRAKPEKFPPRAAIRMPKARAARSNAAAWSHADIWFLGRWRNEDRPSRNRTCLNFRCVVAGHTAFARASANRLDAAGFDKLVSGHAAVGLERRAA